MSEGPEGCGCRSPHCPAQEGRLIVTRYLLPGPRSPGAHVPHVRPDSPRELSPAHKELVPRVGRGGEAQGQAGRGAHQPWHVPASYLPARTIPCPRLSSRDTSREVKQPPGAHRLSVRQLRDAGAPPAARGDEGGCEHRCAQWGCSSGRTVRLGWGGRQRGEGSPSPGEAASPELPWGI